MVDVATYRREGDKNILLLKKVHSPATASQG